MNPDLELAITTQKNTLNFWLDQLDRFYKDDRQELQKQQSKILQFVQQIKRNILENQQSD